HLLHNYMNTNHNYAHKLIKETGSRLVVFGSVHSGKIKDKLVEGFRTISFTVRHRPLESGEVIPVAATLAGAIAFRPFIFSDTESFIEKSLVIENIGEVACLFISIALSLDGRVEDSIPMIDYLLVHVDAKKRLGPKN